MWRKTALIAVVLPVYLALLIYFYSPITSAHQHAPGYTTLEGVREIYCWMVWLEQWPVNNCPVCTLNVNSLVWYHTLKLVHPTNPLIIHSPLHITIPNDGYDVHQLLMVIPDIADIYSFDQVPSNGSQP